MPLEVTVDDLALGGWDLDAARARFEELELKSTWDRVVPLLQDGTLGPPGARLGRPRVRGLRAALRPSRRRAWRGPHRGGGRPFDRSTPRPPPEADDAGRPPSDAARLLASCLAAAGDGPIAVAGVCEGLAGRSPLIGIAVVIGRTRRPGPCGSTPSCSATARSSGGPRGAGRAQRRRPRGEGVAPVARTPLGIDGIELVLDTAVAAYLLDPSRGDYPLDQVAAPFLRGPVGSA